LCKTAKLTVHLSHRESQQIGAQIPTRSLIQVKSHAQKVIKKIESGEDVFSVLDGYHADENDGDMAFHDVVPPKTRLPAARSNGPRRTRARSFSNGSSSSNKSQSYDIMSSSEDEDAAHALSFMHNSPVDGMRPMAPPPCDPPNFSLDAPMMPMNGGHSAHPHMPLNHPQSYGVFSNGMGGMVLGRPEGYVGGASHQPLHHQQPSHHQTVQPSKFSPLLRQNYSKNCKVYRFDNRGGPKTLVAFTNEKRTSLLPPPIPSTSSHPPPKKTHKHSILLP